MRLQTQLLAMYHVAQGQAHSQRCQAHVKLLLNHVKLMQSIRRVMLGRC